MTFIVQSEKLIDSLTIKEESPTTKKQGNNNNSFHNKQGKGMQNFDKEQIPYTFWYEIEDNYGRPKIRENVTKI